MNLHGKDPYMNHVISNSRFLSYEQSITIVEAITLRLEKAGFHTKYIGVGHHDGSVILIFITRIDAMNFLATPNLPKPRELDPYVLAACGGMEVHPIQIVEFGPEQFQDLYEGLESISNMRLEGLN